MSYALISGNVKEEEGKEPWLKLSLQTEDFVLILTTCTYPTDALPYPHPHPRGRAGWECWGRAARSTWEDEMLPVLPVNSRSGGKK